MALTPNSRGLYLCFGLLAGLAVAQFWPHEPALATATDRSDQFAICVGPSTLVEPSDAIYTLDFLTGDLKGAALNASTGKFTQFFYRNILQDFRLDPTVKAKYAIVTGSVQLNSGRGLTTAPTVIYVAELNSGRLNSYTYANRETAVAQPPQPFIPVDGFPFRQPVEKE